VPETSSASILLAEGELNKSPSRKRDREPLREPWEERQLAGDTDDLQFFCENLDIKGATFKPLLNFLLSESGERVLSRIKRDKALERIKALAGPFMPVQILKVQNSGIRALSHLLSSYTGRDVSFETARLCFKKTKDGCSCATEVLHRVLGGLIWPPMSPTRVEAGDRLK
jgi:hypothetical protein